MAKLLVVILAAALVAVIASPVDRDDSVRSRINRSPDYGTRDNYGAGHYQEHEGHSEHEGHGQHAGHEQGHVGQTGYDQGHGVVAQGHGGYDQGHAGYNQGHAGYNQGHAGYNQGHGAPVKGGYQSYGY